MLKLISISSFIGLSTMLSGVANAGQVSVPEIDAGTSAIAIGLTIGVVALIREHRRKK